MRTAREWNRYHMMDFWTTNHDADPCEYHAVEALLFDRLYIEATSQFKDWFPLGTLQVIFNLRWFSDSVVDIICFTEVHSKHKSQFLHHYVQNIFPCER
jgi:hypothetical protein